MEHQTLGQSDDPPSDPTTQQPSILYWILSDFKCPKQNSRIILSQMTLLPSSWDFYGKSQDFLGPYHYSVKNGRISWPYDHFGF